jgi:hypothetical protein
VSGNQNNERLGEGLPANDMYYKIALLKVTLNGENNTRMD